MIASASARSKSVDMIVPSPRSAFKKHDGSSATSRGSSINGSSINGGSVSGYESVVGSARSSMDALCASDLHSPSML